MQKRRTSDVQLEDFTIIGWKHPGGNGDRTFPNGVFYGLIDGVCVTAPESTSDTAYQHARAALLSGAVRTYVLGQIACYEGWLTQGGSENQQQEAKAKLIELRRFLAKVDAFLAR
jgi:hypothetical protein